MKARAIGVGTLLLLLRLAGCGGEDTHDGDRARGGTGPSGAGGEPSGGTLGEGGSRGGAAGSGDGVTEGGESSAGASSDGGQTTSGGAPGSGGIARGGTGGRVSATGGAPSTAGEGSTEGGVAGAGDGGAASGGAASGGASGSGGADEACTIAADCAATARPICDPVTRTCVPYQCTDVLACAVAQVCLTQSDAASGGACYTQCTPFGLDCPGGGECRPLRFDGSLGFCLGRGTGGLGEPCDPPDVVATGCAAGLECATDGTNRTCLEKCNFFVANPDCPSGTVCTVGGVCSPLAVDAAAVGEACATGTAQGSECGQDSGAARGICLQGLQGLACYQICRIQTADCGGGARACLDVFTNIPELGVCVDHGTCGDGGAGQYANCDACINAENAACCSDESSACAVGTPCELLISCLGGCSQGDQACYDDCGAAAPDGIAPYIAYSRCIAGDLSQSFDGACGAVCP